jgi:hypothetical protein
MEYDEDKVDEMILALLHLTTFKEGMGMRLERTSLERHGAPLQERIHFRPSEQGKVRNNDGGRRAKGARTLRKALRSKSLALAIPNSP